MKLCWKFLLVLCLLPGTAAHATTWGSETISDPVDGKACKVESPASMGSYIYDWPSKYDQVFFPVTTEQGLWSCGSGLVTLIGDVQLSYVEKRRVADFLSRLPRDQRQVSGAAQKLARMEALYALRDMDASKRALLHRVMAYDYESLANDPAKAAYHRQQALALMLAQLAGDTLEPGKRLEYLFVSAGYLREQGDRERSDRLLAQLWNEAQKSEAGDQADYAAYLTALIPNVARIAPGGRLAPDGD